MTEPMRKVLLENFYWKLHRRWLGLRDNTRIHRTIRGRLDWEISVGIKNQIVFHFYPRTTTVIERR